MESVVVDVERAEKYDPADAEAHLSDLVDMVERTSEFFIIMCHGRPAACVTPVPEKHRAPSKRASGLLASYADDDKRA